MRPDALMGLLHSSWRNIMAARRKKSPETTAPTEQPPVRAAEHEVALQAVEPTAAVEPSAPSAGEQRQPATEAEGAPRRQWQPDPFPFMAISLGPDKDSPKMTLFRSNRLNQLAIRFDEK